MSEIYIGLAVALDERLVTPVIRRADGKSLAQLAAESRDMAARTRQSRPRPEEISGGSFTITNLGAHEIDGFTPIINPPQTGILVIGRVVEKPVIANGAIVKGLLEDPWWMVACRGQVQRRGIRDGESVSAPLAVKAGLSLYHQHLHKPLPDGVYRQRLQFPAFAVDPV